MITFIPSRKLTLTIFPDSTVRDGGDSEMEKQADAIRGEGDSEIEKESNAIFVRGLPPTVTIESLAQHFGFIGLIKVRLGPAL